MIKLSTISLLVAVFLLMSCQPPTAPPATTEIPIPPTATAALPTATLPATPLPATEEASIPTTVSQVPRIKPQELKEKLDAGEDVIVVDARSREDYESLHIPGALSIPLPEVEERNGELPQGREIVLYCT